MRILLGIFRVRGNPKNLATPQIAQRRMAKRSVKILH
jgi:hypothetical protein